MCLCDWCDETHSHLVLYCIFQYLYCILKWCFFELRIRLIPRQDGCGQGGCEAGWLWCLPLTPGGAGSSEAAVGSSSGSSSGSSCRVGCCLPRSTQPVGRHYTEVEPQRGGGGGGPRCEVEVCCTTACNKGKLKTGIPTSPHPAATACLTPRGPLQPA